MPRKKTADCTRPYDLAKRTLLSDQNREAILQAARKQLEAGGFVNLTMESLARESGVTRQTIHNLFGTKSGVLEALFDRLAMDGGMTRMRSIMQEANSDSMLTGFVEVFTGFWVKDRMLIRRIHGIAAIDPEFGAAVHARDQRRKTAAIRVVDQMDKGIAGRATKDRAERIAALHALTSFEFFNVLCDSCGSSGETADLVLALVRRALALRS